MIYTLHQFIKFAVALTAFLMIIIISATWKNQPVTQSRDHSTYLFDPSGRRIVFIGSVLILADIYALSLESMYCLPILFILICHALLSFLSKNKYGVFLYRCLFSD